MDKKQCDLKSQRCAYSNAHNITKMLRHVVAVKIKKVALECLLIWKVVVFWYAALYILIWDVFLCVWFLEVPLKNKSK